MELSNEALTAKRQEVILQPVLGQPIAPRSLGEIKDLIGKTAKLVGQAEQAKLIFTTRGIDPFTGKNVTAMTTYNHLGLMENIRSSHEGYPTTLVEFSYRLYEGPKAGFQDRWEIEKAQTYLEITGSDGKKEKVPIQTADLTWVNGKLERTDKEYKGNPLRDELIALAKPFPPVGFKTNGKAEIARARELAKKHLGFKVIDYSNGNKVIEILKPGRFSEVSISPVANRLVRKTFNNKKWLVGFEQLAQPLRPGIDPIRSDTITYAYNEDGNMTVVKIENDQDGGNHRFFTFSYKTLEDSSVVIDKKMVGTGESLATAVMSEF